MPKEPAPTKDAPAPFSGAVDPETDIHLPDFILRSSDGVDFHVHRDILKFASDCFDGMFAIAGGHCDPNDLHRDGKPVLVLAEPEDVLLRLLRLSYPADTPVHYTLQRADLEIFVAVYTAARKYQFFRVQQVLKEMLSNSPLLDAQPHRLFAIAWLCDFPELSRKAALLTLTSPLSNGVPAFPEKRFVSWETLARFHKSCGRKAREIALDSVVDRSNSEAQPFWISNADTDQVFVWWQYYGHNSQCTGTCRESWGYGGKVVRRGSKGPVSWFRGHIPRVAAQLRLWPAPATAEREARRVAQAERLNMDACVFCSEQADADLACFARQLAKTIDLSNHRLADKAFR
ncbi:hypothetical protein B0H11DRAFT_2286292 [Mycena galericulata]|nr:hypothetical protein B0H11DRAFT_2286292 [Mycena galericulata]